MLIYLLHHWYRSMADSSLSAMLHQFLMTLQTEILSTVTSDFFKQRIILKSFNSMLIVK